MNIYRDREEYRKKSICFGNRVLQILQALQVLRLSLIFRGNYLQGLFAGLICTTHWARGY